MDEIDEDIAVVDKAVASLMTRFDTVHISVTLNDRAKTFAINRGGGNIYAQEGALRAWLIQQEEATRMTAALELFPQDEEDEGEDDEELCD